MIETLREALDTLLEKYEEIKIVRIYEDSFILQYEDGICYVNEYGSWNNPPIGKVGHGVRKYFKPRPTI